MLNKNVKYSMMGKIENEASKPYVMVCVPSRVTEVEKRAVIDATRLSGAKDVFIIEEPFATEIGAGLPVMDPTGSMVNDIGGGTTDVATISIGGIVSSRTIRLAGDRMVKVIIQSIRKKHNLLIGERTAGQIKMDIGCASVEKAVEYGTIDVRCRYLLTGLPKTIDIAAVDIAEAIQEVTEGIVIAVRETLEETSPEISADVIDHGIVLTGDGALLKDIADVIAKDTDVPVFEASEPLDCVAVGTGESLQHIDVYRNRTIKG